MHPHRILSLFFLLFLSLALAAARRRNPARPCLPSPWNGATGSSSRPRTARA